MYLVTRGSSTSSSNSARLRSCLAAALSCSEANELPHKVHSVSAVWTSTVESPVTTAVPVRTLGGSGMYRLLGWLPCQSEADAQASLSIGCRRLRLN